MSNEFWDEVLKKVAMEPERSVRVDHRHYMITPDLPPERPKHLAGHSGALFQIAFHNGRRVESRNLWHQGEIPEEYWDRLPDNAVFA